MSRQLCVRVPDELAERIDTRARRLGRTRSDVVRDALACGLPIARPSPTPLNELMGRAAALRAGQPERSDAAALIRETRDRMPLRLRLMRLAVPFPEADLT